MFSRKFELEFVDCLKRQRNFYLFLKDSTSSNKDDIRLTCDSIAPQYSVSTIHIDASKQSVSLERIIDLVDQRAKKVLSALEFSDYLSGKEKLFFAAKILEDTLFVVHNAEKIARGELLFLQDLCSEINSQDGVRLRVAAIGDMGLIHCALRDKLKFISLKFYNLMQDKEEMDAVLTRVAGMTVGTHLGGVDGESDDVASMDKTKESAASFIYFGKQL